MKITIEIDNCHECPFYNERYEFGEYTNFCGHSKANNHINLAHAYLNVGNNALPNEGISCWCPYKK